MSLFPLDKSFLEAALNDSMADHVADASPTLVQEVASKLMETSLEVGKSTAASIA